MFMAHKSDAHTFLLKHWSSVLGSTFQELETIRIPIHN